MRSKAEACAPATALSLAMPLSGKGVSMRPEDRATDFVIKAVAEHKKVGTALDHAKAAGDWLVKARDEIGAGKGWLKWAKANVFEQIPRATCYRYIKIAQNWTEAKKAGGVKKAGKALTKNPRPRTPAGPENQLAEVEVVIKDATKHPDKIKDVGAFVSRLVALQAACGAALAKLTAEARKAA